MIVTCEQCSTQFRLDDSKVPEGGARVRCSKCKHAFFIAPPGQADDVAATDLAREALSPGKPAEESEESDWEFNHDTPAQEDAGDLTAGDADGDGSVDIDTGLDLDTGPDLGPAPDLGAGPDLGSELGSDLDSDLGSELGGDAGSSLDGLDANTVPDLGDTQPITPEAGPAAAAEPAVEEDATAPDLGDPSEWNIFEEVDSKPQTDAGRAAIGRVALVRRWQVAGDEEDPSLSDRAEAAATLDQGEPSAGVRVLRAVGHAVGWLATAGLLAATLVGVYAPAPVSVASPLEVSGLAISELRVRWIENAVAGPIHVVSGVLANPAASGRLAGGPLEVRLLDAAGQPLGPRSPAGPPFSEPALRERDPAELVAAQERAAPEFARLHPDEAVSFQAVFPELPAAAARFDVAPLR